MKSDNFHFLIRSINYVSPRAAVVVVAAAAVVVVVVVVVLTYSYDEEKLFCRFAISVSNVDIS